MDGKELISQNHSGQTNSPYLTDSSVLANLGSKSMVTADFNRDGLDDILELISNNVIQVHLNEGNNQFPTTPLSVTSQTLTVDQIMVADLSGDGYPDVIALDKTNGKILSGHGIQLLLLQALLLKHLLYLPVVYQVRLPSFQI